MKTLVIEKKALKHNISIVREKAGPAAIYGVLTGDGFGIGAVPLALCLREEGIRRFAVSEVSEAEALRKAGLVDEELLMLRSTTDPEELDRMLDLNVICTVNSPETGLALERAAEKRSTIAEAQIQLDAGLGFGGFLTDDPEAIVSVFRTMPKVAVSGFYTQMNTLRSGAQAEARLEPFRQVVRAVHAAGFETGILHAAGSYTLMHCGPARLDAVRAGSVLLGRCRREKGDGLLEVGYGETAVTELRWLPRGCSVGYERPRILRRPTRAAVLPVGSQNGFGVLPIRGSSLWTSLGRWWRARHCAVRINGQRAPVLGRIGAIQTLVDVTDIPCEPGATAYFDIDPLYARGMKREYR